VPQFQQLPPSEWQLNSLPTAECLALQSMMADGDTPADRPGSLSELVERQAEAVRGTAAMALSSLAQADTNLCNEAARILHLALRGRPSATLTRRLLTALAQMRPDAGLNDLGRLLADGSLDMTVRWLAIEQLGEGSNAVPVLLRYLQSGTIDSFLAVKLVEQLGRIGAAEAVPPLRQLAERANDMQIREAAAAALGNLNESTIEDTLLHLLNDGALPLSLRVVASTALPSDLTMSTRQVLRENLRNNRPSAALAAAILSALGRAADRESLPMFLHYAQSEQPGEALAAIEALGQLGDDSISPILVRINQNPALAPEVRLAAAGALLRLIGEEAMPLLQQAVGANNLSLQIQAFDLLSTARPAAVQLRSPLVDRSAPLVLRLRAVTSALAHGLAQSQLEDILASGLEPLQLRVLIATALGRNSAAESVDLLTIIALSIATPPLLRRRVIDALAALARTAQGRSAGAALGRIAHDTSPPTERWHWATQALLTL
jgi:HEAT repeat protein